MSGTDQGSATESDHGSVNDGVQASDDDDDSEPSYQNFETEDFYPNDLFSQNVPSSTHLCPACIQDAPFGSCFENTNRFQPQQPHQSSNHSVQQVPSSSTSDPPQNNSGESQQQQQPPDLLFLYDNLPPHLMFIDRTWNVVGQDSETESASSEGMLYEDLDDYRSNSYNQSTRF